MLYTTLRPYVDKYREDCNIKRKTNCLKKDLRFEEIRFKRYHQTIKMNLKNMLKDLVFDS